jgi:hypothetical protein
MYSRMQGPGWQGVPVVPCLWAEVAEPGCDPLHPCAFWVARQTHTKCDPFYTPAAGEAGEGDEKKEEECEEGGKKDAGAGDGDSSDDEGGKKKRKGSGAVAGPLPAFGRSWLGDDDLNLAVSEGGRR